MLEKMFEQYNKVFDENGDPRLCGREACKELILMCEENMGHKGLFGNIETGFMNVENIHALFEELKKEQNIADSVLEGNCVPQKKKVYDAPSLNVEEVR